MRLAIILQLDFIFSCLHQLRRIRTVYDANLLLQILCDCIVYNTCIQHNARICRNGFHKRINIIICMYRYSIFPEVRKHLLIQLILINKDMIFIVGD